MHLFCMQEQTLCCVHFTSDRFKALKTQNSFISRQHLHVFFTNSRETRSAESHPSVLHVNLTDVSLEFLLEPTRSVFNPKARVTVFDQGGERQQDRQTYDCIYSGYSKTDPNNKAVISRCTGLVRYWKHTIVSIFLRQRFLYCFQQLHTKEVLIVLLVVDLLIFSKCLLY